jgi:hypothetical protein
MAVSSDTNRVIYDGDGSTTEFPITFSYLGDTDLIVVTLRTVATGAETVLSGGGVDYSIADDTVTTVETYESTHQIVISRDVPYTQATDWVENENFSAEVLEAAIDKLTILCGQLKDSLDRSLTIPITDPTSLDMEIPDSVSRASKFMAFTSSGAATVSDTQSLGSITAFVETLIDDADAAEFLQTLMAARYEGTSNYTVLDDDGYNIIEITLNANSTATVTLPTEADNSNRWITIQRAMGSYGPAAGYQEMLTIQNEGGGVKGTLYGDGASKTFICDGSEWHSIASSLYDEVLVPIGVWNMDANAYTDVTIPVALGAGSNYIVHVDAVIFEDSNQYAYSLNGDNRGKIAQTSTTNIRLYRTASGDFDATAFNDTNINRGWVIVKYLKRIT